ncbi:MAG TPA: hydroxymethylbilane synthase [Parachlamydiaceae bacterium]|nr:hydroxymethylbilane synthase [Parachlamydiaceae bacterium]
MILTLTSRRSPLAIAQVDEVLKEITLHHPSVQFSCHFIDTTGDIDQKTSLRSLDKTDFFTKEIDEALLSGACRIAVHSAKDLPEPLPQGITLVALTRGVDSSDALVLKPGKTPANLPPKALIATSSVRREEAVRQLMPHASFTDIRGTVNQRLMSLEHDSIDGVVVAEAALIRLGLTNLNRFKLPGDTTPLQGQLAVMARSEDTEMHFLFSCIDARQCVH